MNERDRILGVFWIIIVVFLILVNYFVYLKFNFIFYDVLIASTSLFFTILFLYILLPLTKKLQWKRVKSKVRKSLSEDLEGIFSTSIGFFKGGILNLSGKDAKEGRWDKALLRKLEEFSKKEKIQLSKSGKIYFESVSENYFLDYKNNISEIERKYFEFFSPEEISSIIDIQYYLKVIRNIHFAWNNKNPLFSPNYQSYESELSKYFVKLYKEIDKLKKNLDLFLYYNKNNSKRDDISK